MANKFETRSIPAAFVRKLPEGLKILSKKGQSFVVVDDLRCSKGHRLLSDNVRLHGEPSISFKVRGGGIDGTLYLDPFWGLHEKLYDFMFSSCDKPPILRAFCPECGVSLMKKKKCETKGCRAEEYIVFIYRSAYMGQPFNLSAFRDNAKFYFFFMPGRLEISHMTFP